MRVNPFPDLKTFKRLSRQGHAVPISVEMDADTETAVSAFLKISKGETHAFLFESVEGGERSGRWSFLGVHPRKVFQWNLGGEDDPISRLARELAIRKTVPLQGLPRFSGGWVGYLGYDAVKLFEPRVPISKPKEVDFADALFMDFETVVAIDNVRHSLHIVSEAIPTRGQNWQTGYDAAVEKIARMYRRLRRPLVDRRRNGAAAQEPLRPRQDRASFEQAVRRAQRYIRAGDCQQVVLAQRFDATTRIPPFDIYRALRRINPSPYLFYLQAKDSALIGSSPETLVRLEKGEITLRPIAGTRPRGKDHRSDLLNEQRLRADPKENAEHVMLVDLGRNDVGRVAQIGSVRVDVFKTVERYSHVMHLVSQVRGHLKKGYGALDVLRATFPAGTVTGAPKVRAMEIIDELERSRRGPYAGSVGYIDRQGNLEMCIAIRTLAQRGKNISVQAGCGIVYDSKPAKEYEETVNKAQALFVALRKAAEGNRGEA